MRNGNEDTMPVEQASRPNQNHGDQQEEGVVDKVKRMGRNCCMATGLCCFKTKKQTEIQTLEFKINQRKKKFGLDYMNLMEQKAPQQELNRCMGEARKDIADLRKQIETHNEKIDHKTEKVQSKINMGPTNSSAATTPPTLATDGATKPSSATSSMGGSKTASPTRNKKPQTHPGVNPFGSTSPAGSPNKARNGKPQSRPDSNPLSNSPKNKKKPASPAKKIPIVRDTAGKAPKMAASHPSLRGSTNTNNHEDDPYYGADPSRWTCTEHKFAGAASYESMGKKETVKGTSIAEGIRDFKAHPELYVAMQYQTSMLDWKADQCQFIYIHRAGTKGYTPKGVNPSGWMTVLVHDYQALPKFPNNELPKQHRDAYTDQMTFQGRKLHKPILPGRGMGVCDTPLIKIIGDVDPSDIHQGQVGNCWMLSGISALAEFDGAVKKLFRKTKFLDQMPRDGPNKYTVTLWDLKTWKEVDIEIDERLCVAPNNSSGLLASKPSVDGELWVCYLEKALAIHCGGWDKIVGGQCTHAWALMTGCKYQYMITRNARTGKFSCGGKFNPNTKKWSKQSNSPHDCDASMWPMDWPQVGGGGSGELEQEELFQRMCAWDDVNFIVGAATNGASDKHCTEGMVDNHAYSVIECHNDVAGTDIDLIKVRNPWGRGEIEDGMFDDDGPGWDRYPQIKRQLKPVVADDGIFWVTKQEFFRFFGTIFLSASNMTEFLED